ncbi:MAG TPA: YceH family protein [Acidimicrobiales bacterium]|nr:YceH family protein [Acidimicrobiales bacterium]
MELSAAEIRVLGSLVEKQLTTPQQYPLTLNALTLACSQSSNRDPVVAYDEPTVEGAVTSIKTKGLARFVHPSHGRSALRYAHSLDDALGLAPPQLALVAVLMLRGPQTLGELRTRTERMVRFSDLREVQAELDALAERTEPLTRRLPRGPGQKEDRYGQLLGGPPPPTWRGPDPDRPPAPAAQAPAPALDVESGAVDFGEVAALRAELVELRAEVAALRRALDDLREQLGA